VGAYQAGPDQSDIVLATAVLGLSLARHGRRAGGRAEAILWHGGEAERSREAFRRMSEAEREALLTFLRSL